MAALRTQVAGLAEPALRAHGLLVRPIPFFDHLDRFRETERKLAEEYEPHLMRLSPATAGRVLRTGAFAEQLCRQVLRRVCPEWPPGGERTVRNLWAAAVLLDQLLDEEQLDLDRLEPLRRWLDALATSGSESRFQIPLLSGGPGVLAAMLQEVWQDCLDRAADRQSCLDFRADLLKLYDTEASSVRLTLDVHPSERVRAMVREKSVRLCWVGFRSCTLGLHFDPKAEARYRKLCDALGEILWIMDDLADLGEDLDRGVWNRALWHLWDEVGPARFRSGFGDPAQVAGWLGKTGLVAREVGEMSHRLDFLQAHASDEGEGDLRGMLSFWITSWLGVYA